MKIEQIQKDTIDTYISQFPKEVQNKLQELRHQIHQASPEVVEMIKYRMPTFFLHGNLVHFAAYQNHIGFYSGSSGVENFLPKLSQYKTSKGAIQFPITESIPFDLIREIVLFRTDENIKQFHQKQLKNKQKNQES